MAMTGLALSMSTVFPLFHISSVMFACLIPDSVNRYIFSVLNKIILDKLVGKFMALSFLYTHVNFFFFPNL